MASKRMRAAAIEAMQKECMPQAVVDAYVREFDRVWDGVGVPLPCPTCFMRGKVSWLHESALANGAQGLACTVCGGEFDADDE